MIRISPRAGAIRHATLAALTLLALMAALAGTAAARSAQGHGPIRGIVPSRGSSTSSTAGTASNLIFHGGPVLSGNTAYAVYWSTPTYPISSSYQTLINRYFSDVAAATSAGATNNVYAAATQYGKGTAGSTVTSLGSLSNVTTFGGSYVDTDPIANGCRDRATHICVTDAQVVSELQKVMAARGWTAGSNHLYFMFTPRGVGSCYSNSSCSFTQWCAYHSNAGSLLYANMAFADTVASACDAGYHPNAAIDPYADATISVVSHEHNEAITDPLGSAWYNSSGYENGDLCAWNFGAMLGGSGSGRYNQVINGHDYTLQQEWSNHSAGCVLTGV